MSAYALDTQAIDNLVTYVGHHMPEEIAQLSALAKIPSVSFEGHDHAHVVASAEAVAAAIRDLEIFDSVKIIRDESHGGLPGVMAYRAPASGASRVLLYAHHDVQPLGDLDEWETEPYMPTLRGERLYGRGTSDDKAGVASHLAALKAFKASVDAINIGLAMFIEGEEEAGSVSFEHLLKEHRDSFEAEAIVVADSGNWDTETPALTSTLRGNVVFNVSVRTLDHALHSGQFGGMVLDATTALVITLGSLWNTDGSVAVALPSSAEATYPPYPESQLREETGLLPELQPLGGLREVWGEPSITVTGTDVPQLAHAGNALLPKATAKLSIRVAPGTEPAAVAEAVQAHLRAHAPAGVIPEFSPSDLGAPFNADLEGDYAQTMLQSMEDGWGKAPVAMGQGGSIPFIATLKTLFPEAEVLVTGVEDPDTRAHSPNESQHLGVLRKATAAEAVFLARINRGGCPQPENELE